MQIILNNSSMVPIYEQVAAQIRVGILEGALKEEEALPSVRGLASELKISALTVKKAYDYLEEEGYVVTVHGKGTYVAAANKAFAEEFRKKQVEDSLAAAVAKARMLGVTSEEIRAILELLLETEER